MTNEEKVSKVLSLMEDGKSERSACKEADISRSTFRTTALRVKTGDQYARALEGLAMDQIEKLEVTIQDMRDGTLDPAIGRIEVEARKWFASKFLPKQFGDKITQEHTGSIDVNQLTDAQLDEKIASLLANAAPK